MDSRLRRFPPDRASAVPYGQAGENALRFPHLAHRSAAAHKLHSATATTRYEFDSGKSETISRLPALAYSPRKLSKPPGPSHTSQDYPGYDKVIAKLRQSRAADLTGSGAAWIGSLDEIIDQISRTQQEFGSYEHASLQVNFNMVPLDDALASMRLFAERVMPRFTREA